MPNAISALILNGVTQIDLRQDTTGAAKTLYGETGHGNDGEAFTGTITSRSASDLTASGDTVTVPAGHYAAQATKSVAAGTAGTPTASKGTVSNHAVTVTPSVTNTAGYISGGTKTGTGVSVSASELVSGSQNITTNNTYDVTNLASVVVNVASSGKVTQAYRGYATVANTAYTATAVSITVAKAGTYNISWMGWRSYNANTFGSQLYKNGTAVGTATTSFLNTYGHSVSLSNQTLAKDDVLTVYARSSGTTRYMAVGNLIIEEV